MFHRTQLNASTKKMKPVKYFRIVHSWLTICRTAVQSALLNKIRPDCIPCVPALSRLLTTTLHRLLTYLAGLHPDLLGGKYIAWLQQYWGLMRLVSSSFISVEVSCIIQLTFLQLKLDCIIIPQHSRGRFVIFSCSPASLRVFYYKSCSSIPPDQFPRLPAPVALPAH